MSAGFPGKMAFNARLASPTRFADGCWASAQESWLAKTAAASMRIEMLMGVASENGKNRTLRANDRGVCHIADGPCALLERLLCLVVRRLPSGQRGPMRRGVCGQTSDNP